MKTSKQPDPMDVFVGERIRALRNAKEMSQTTLGKELGVTFQQIQKYEKGVNRVSAGRLSKIATLFGAQVSDFYPDNTGAIGATIMLDDPCHRLSLTTRGMRIAIAFIRLQSTYQDVVISVAEALGGK